MVRKITLASAGLVLLGIIVTAAGAVIEPTANLRDAGQSLIALGLTFLLVGLGLFLSSTPEAA